MNVWIGNLWYWPWQLWQTVSNLFRKVREVNVILQQNCFSLSFYLTSIAKTSYEITA